MSLKIESAKQLVEQHHFDDIRMNHETIKVGEKKVKKEKLKSDY